ncbi:hypothetical protein [Caproiciproducens sp.]
MVKYSKEEKHEMKLLTTYLWFKKAINGGLLKCIEKDNMNQAPVNFKNVTFNHETFTLTVNFNNGTTREIILPINYGVELVEPENNPDYKGFQRIGLWDTENMYCFDAQF